MFSETDEQKRYTGTPHLVVEILSSEPARDTIRKFAKYAAAGVERFWIIDPDGPEIIVYELGNEVLVEVGRHRQRVTVDVGPTQIEVDPTDLVL